MYRFTDHDRVDTNFRGMETARSRRGVVLGLLGGAVGLLGLTEAEAKHKKRHGHKKKLVDPAPPPSPPASPPASPLPGPTATEDATCVAIHGYARSLRQGQTFRALRSGQLTSATVFLAVCDEGDDFDVEIWSVNQANLPRAVLAGATIANVPRRVATDPPHRLTATFAAPANVVAGLRYALVVTGPDNGYGLEGNLDRCPGGNYVYAQTVNDPFTPMPDFDLHFETFVTA